MSTTKMLSTKAFEQWLTEQAVIASRYREIEKSAVLSEYQSLKSFVESDAFLAKKHELTTTKYADTVEGKTMTRLSQLKWCKTVLLYRLLKKEKYQNLPEVIEYMSLLAEVSTEAFKQSNAFWKNAKRWYTTEECKKEQRLVALSKHADILFYLSHTEEEVARLESYQCIWMDDFEGSALNAQWQYGFLYPSKDFVVAHSHVSELQAYNKGKNTKVSSSVLSLKTKKEKCTAPAWHPTKGMLLQDFAFTSDVWHTADAVAPASGVLVAKVNCSGLSRHAISLTTKKLTAALPVLHAESIIKGYVIYSLVWNEKELVSYVNNVEVARSKNSLAGEALHIVLRSYLPVDQKAGVGRMDIDWIRVYSNK